MPILASSGKPVGFRVEPQFGINWHPLRTLRHLAALVEHRTGHEVRIAPAEADGQYLVKTAHNLGGPAPYEVTYAWLSGFENGIHEVLWRMSKREK